MFTKLNKYEVTFIALDYSAFLKKHFFFFIKNKRNDSTSSNSNYKNLNGIIKNTLLSNITN